MVLASRSLLLGTGSIQIEQEVRDTANIGVSCLLTCGLQALLTSEDAQGYF